MNIITTYILLWLIYYNGYYYDRYVIMNINMTDIIIINIIMTDILWILLWRTY